VPRESSESVRFFAERLDPFLGSLSLFLETLSKFLATLGSFVESLSAFRAPLWSFAATRLPVSADRGMFAATLASLAESFAARSMFAREPCLFSKTLREEEAARRSFAEDLRSNGELPSMFLETRDTLLETRYELLAPLRERVGMLGEKVGMGRNLDASFASRRRPPELRSRGRRTRTPSPDRSTCRRVDRPSRSDRNTCIPASWELYPLGQGRRPPCTANRSCMRRR
jgi:hypothetical protein